MSKRLLQLKERSEAESKKAREVAQKAADNNREMTADEKAIYDAAMTELKGILDAIKTVKADEDVLAQAKEFSDSVGVPEQAELKARAKALGLQVVESPEFKAMLKPFTAPDGRLSIPAKARIQSDPISVKSLFTGGSDTSAGAFVTPDRTDIVEMLGRRPLTIRQLCSNRQTTSDLVEFVRQTSHTNAAAPVPEATSSAAPTAPGSAGALVRNPGGGYKPEGSWAFEVDQAPVKTIAEWVPATKRALADWAALQGLINDELSLDVAEKEEDEILNGDGTGEHFIGVNNTDGIQQQAWVASGDGDAASFFTTTRKAVTKVRTVGRAQPTAWVMNPEDAETVDLLRDSNQQFYYPGGPFRIGERTLWGYPIVESEAQAAGDGVLADWRKAVVWDREQTTVTMSDSHEDYFVRNLVAVLAEERLAFAVTRPAAVCQTALKP